MKTTGMRLSAVLLALLLAMSPMGTAHAAVKTVEIPVVISLEGPKPEQAETFVLELKPEDSANPMPERSENGVFRLYITGENSGRILFPCEKLGVFEYALRLLPGKNPDCTYDPAVYRLRLFVTNGENGHVGSVVVLGDAGEKQERILFHNIYAAPATVTIRARKTLDGKTPEDGAFAFRLLDANRRILYEVENRGRDVTFPEMTFRKEGKYLFLLKEINEGREHILYDHRTYTVTVEVTKDVNYHAEVIYSYRGETLDGIPLFRNKTETESPKTGDTIRIYGTVMVLSAGGLWLLLALRRRRRR